ncbi:hypothetical protein EZE58_02500 [Brevibacterium sp. LS14]|uniref:helix-turn-helix domain-containing protein n=1 Tax=Brevibacterium sp. LS14 TaxID=2528962 RepID=UPI00143070E3|nr:hypothetical protein [Brevibacterium sp. LS14]
MQKSAVTLDDLFAKNLAAQRERSGLTKTDLARLMQEAGWDSYSQMTVTRTESGSRKVGVAEAHALADSLQVPYQALLQDDTERKVQEYVDRLSQSQFMAQDSVYQVLALQDDVATILDAPGTEVSSRLELRARECLDWNALSYLRREMARFFADDAAQAEELERSESGIHIIYRGPWGRKLQERIERQFKLIEEASDRYGVDQEEA